MPAGYSGTPLAKKLGIKPGFRILLEDQPAYYFNLFDDLPEITLIEDDSSEEIDFIHFFVKGSPAKKWYDVDLLAKKGLKSSHYG